MLIKRKNLEKNEAKCLASYAIKSQNSKGRFFTEKEDQFRLCFQKDKERIIHCKAFRRLDEKTQVFVAGSGDHYRTRLTHTLEVAQISRDLARRLGLNEDLCEAIALAHDLGHPPFGHAGEDALNDVMHDFDDHFEHNEQSRRVVEKLEKTYPQFDGLNLTKEVLDGLIKHQTAFDQEGVQFEISPHLEAQIVNIADEIAYINHDIDDGVRSGLIKLTDFDNFPLWENACEHVFDKYGRNLSDDVFLARTISALISIMIEDLCVSTENNIVSFRIESPKDVEKHKGILAVFSSETQKQIKELRQFLYENFYMNKRIISHVDKGKKMIKELFMFYIDNPDKFPSQISADQKAFYRNVKDYIAGMTDNYLRNAYKVAFPDGKL